MPITILDMIVIGVVLISALLAALRGFTREVLAIASWAVAAAAAYVFYPQVMPLAQQYISTNRNVALGASVGGIFLLTLLVSYFITAKLSDIILDSRIGALDRTLGFLFGAARGLLLAVVAFLFFNWLVVEQQRPSWVRDAKLRPLLEQSGSALLALLPEDPEKLIRDRLQRRGTEGDTPREPPVGTDPQRRSEAPATPGPADRAALQRLIESSPQGQRPPAPAPQR